MPSKTAYHEPSSSLSNKRLDNLLSRFLGILSRTHLDVMSKTETRMLNNLMNLLEYKTIENC